MGYPVLTGLLSAPTRFLFFTGKGGVGKTSTACAVAVALADGGARVLVVSTDPASNLGDVLGVPAAQVPTPVPAVAHLSAVDIDPEQAAVRYRERVLAPYRDALPPTAVMQIEEQLSGACTVEVAGFNEFVDVLTDPGVADRFDHVIFDTAPTGHTLRLLSLPAAWSGFLAGNPAGAACIGPMSGLEAQQGRYVEAVEALRDARRTTVVLVARPDRPALAEADHAARELAELGITRQHLVINGVFHAGPAGDAVAVAWQRHATEALASLPPALAAIRRVDRVPLLAQAPLGPDGLRALLSPPPAPPAAHPVSAPSAGLPEAGLVGLVDQIEAGGPGLVLTMGKGGVGKTTVAGAVAVELARRGHRVTLTTTDPAAHVEAVVGAAPDGLSVTRIDPAEETAAHTAAVLAAAGGLDPEARRLLEEDLRSPCTEEVAVFNAFARTVAAGQDRFVVVDTAPTGHTLLLLDASRSYQRELHRQTAGQPAPHALDLLGRLSDPAYTRILLVTVPETTPIHEATRLQDDLARAGITPFGWVINQSLAATGSTHSLLAARAAAERHRIDEITASHAQRVAVLPWACYPPLGAPALTALAAGHVHAVADLESVTE